jgi:hypothetical protein
VTGDQRKLHNEELHNLYSSPNIIRMIKSRREVTWDFVMDKSGAGAGFLRELRFPLPIYTPSASPQSSSLLPEAGTIGQEWPQCQKPHKPNKKIGQGG